jgi:hypothetical protein
MVLFAPLSQLVRPCIYLGDLYRLEPEPGITCSRVNWLPESLCNIGVK